MPGSALHTWRCWRGCSQLVIEGMIYHNRADPLIWSSSFVQVRYEHLFEFGVRTSNPLHKP